MDVIYLDVLFLINLTANYLLLLMTARMGGKVIRRIPFFFSAALGGVYASAQACGMNFLGHLLCKIGVGILMVLIAFGNRKGLFRSVIQFFCAAAALGGMVLAVELVGGNGLTLKNGVLYSWLDIRLLLLLLILSYGVITMISNRTFLHHTEETTCVHITAGGQTVRLIALIDTGNTLSELGNNKPVLIAEGEACRCLLPCDLPLDRPVEAMEILNGRGLKGFTLLPYRAVGVQVGLLLALRAEQIKIGKTIRKNMLVALSPTSVSDGGGYQALIGGRAWE